MVTVLETDALPALLAALEEHAAPWTVMGAGSNTVVADRGFPGVVIKLEAEFSYVEVMRGSQGDLVAGAALSLPRLSTYAADRGLSGLEFAGGIPGSVGGAIVMNAGAHGASVSDVVVGVQVALPEGLFWLSADEVHWEYRACRLPVSGAVITAMAFSLVPADISELLARQRGYLRLRRKTQPRGVRTFGSAFKNPRGESAGRLLESAGLKGVRRGGAEVSPVHANFLANVGEASAADVLGLMGMMRETVYLKHQVFLEPEVSLLGATFPWRG
jgi:UDP-N-acetylmuramate dehydrogenase